MGWTTEPTSQRCRLNLAGLNKAKLGPVAPLCAIPHRLRAGMRIVCGLSDGEHHSTRVHYPLIGSEIPMNKEQFKGHYEEAKGTVKEVTGKITGNEELEIKGQVQKQAGKVQAGFGDVEEEVKDKT